MSVPRCWGKITGGGSFARVVGELWIIMESMSGMLSVDLLLLLLLHLFAVSALTLLVGRQEGHPARKKYGGMVEVGTG